MASEKVKKILISEGAPFTPQELSSMSNQECWDWLYEHRPPKRSKDELEKPEICFTGFSPERKNILGAQAEKIGFRVVKSVTKNLEVLVTGDNAGPAKIEKANVQGARIISEDDFLKCYGLSHLV